MGNKRPDSETAFVNALSRVRPDRGAAIPVEAREVGQRRLRDVFYLQADRIRVDENQVRQNGKGPDDPDTIDLAGSISERGLMQYPQVRYLADDDVYEIVSGERRFAACTQILGWEEIPVKLIDVDEAEIAWVQLHENIHRRDLSPIELAMAIGQAKESGLSLQQIADKLKKSRTFVQKSLTIAHKLTKEARRELERGKAGKSREVTYAVATLPPDEQEQIAQEIVAKNLSKKNVVDLLAERKPQSHRKSRKRVAVRSVLLFEQTIAVSPQASVTVIVRGEKRVKDGELRRALQQVVADLCSPSGKPH